MIYRKHHICISSPLRVVDVDVPDIFVVEKMFCHKNHIQSFPCFFASTRNFLLSDSLSKSLCFIKSQQQNNKNFLENTLLHTIAANFRSTLS